MTDNSLREIQSVVNCAERLAGMNGTTRFEDYACRWIPVLIAEIKRLRAELEVKR